MNLLSNFKFSAHENLTSSFVITKNHDRDKYVPTLDFIFRHVRFNHARYAPEIFNQFSKCETKFAILNFKLRHDGHIYHYEDHHRTCPMP